MTIEIKSIGGYSEIGKNMTAIRIDDEVVLCDMGIHLENYIAINEDDDVANIPLQTLIEKKAVPNISDLKDWKEKVKAIVPTHAHLDHIGAIPFMAREFDAPIICTPFTSAVLKRIIEDTKIPFENQIKVLNANSSIKISEKITIEFISITHSTPQTVIIAIHTPYGKICYANDFKLDNYPIVGTKVNFKRLKQLGKNGNVLCLIIDSLYADNYKKTPSESVAREMLKDVLLGTNSEGKAIIVTTFSSQIARLKSIVDFGKRMNRKIVFLGRSLSRYVYAAEEIGLVNFSKEVELIPYSSKIKPKFNKIIKEGTDKYLIVVTGHQGEPKSVLTRMANGDFDFMPGDHVIFSTSVIPSPINIKNREVLENKLQRRNVRIFTDIHVSGHAAREDQRDLIEMLKPKHIIPAHSDVPRIKKLLELALEIGYKEENVHILKNNEIVKFD
jgi:ribonuclease J